MAILLQQRHVYLTKAVAISVLINEWICVGLCVIFGSVGGGGQRLMNKL
jgi:hypothetical protein